VSRIIVQSEKVIASKPADVYAILADYKGGHRRLLPANFLDYRVEEGERGEGTVISYRLRAGGRERLYRMRVSEPVRGQTLTESDLNSSLVTTWTLTPLADGQQTQVRVATMWEGGNGLGGFFERLFAPLGLRPIYDQMLAALALLTQGGTPAAHSERRSPLPILLAAAAITVLTIPLGMRLLQQRRKQAALRARSAPAMQLKKLRARGLRMRGRKTPAIAHDRQKRAMPLLVASR
jgi:hypothetical protein